MISPTSVAWCVFVFLAADEEAEASCVGVRRCLAPRSVLCICIFGC
jgi:hypothetical protein